MAIWELAHVTFNNVEIKFDDPIRASTLVNANFTLTQDAATPVPVLSPFKPIDLTKDYRSLTRTLFLWWNVTLQGDTAYTIHIKNLKNSITGETIDDGDIKFRTAAGPSPAPNTNERVTREPIEVEDYSIKSPPAIGPGVGSGGGSGVTLPGDDETLSIVSVTPDVSQSYYLEPDDYDGKIVIQFSSAPAANYVNSQDFKVQKRLITSGIAKWENVDTVVAADSTAPRVNIYLPSDDATPTYSYMTSPEVRVYWEPGYQYRLIISKNVGI